MANVQLNVDIIGALDLGEHTESPFKLTRSLSDISDLASRSDIRSTSFKIPDSKSNVAALMAFFDAKYTNTDDIDGELGCDYLVDGQFRERGTIKINTTYRNNGIREFECVYFAGNLQWWRDLKNYTIADLDWSDVGSITRNMATISSSWNNTSGVVFPLIDRGKRDRPQNELGVDGMDFYPELFVHTLIEKMGDIVGVTFDSTIFDSAQFQKYVLTWFGKRFLKHESVNGRIVKSKTTGNAAQTLFGSIPVTGRWSSPIYNKKFGGFENGSGQWVDVTDDLNEHDDTEFTASIEQTYKVTISVTFSSDRNTPPPVYIGFGLRLENAAGNQFIDYRNITDYFEVPESTNTQTATTVITPITIPVGWKAYIYHQVWREDIDTGYTSTALVRMLPGTTITYEPEETQKEISIGTSFTIDEVWNNEITCFEWFNDFCRLFHLYVETDVGAAIVTAETRDDFYKSLDVAEDWTSRLDTSKPIISTFNSKLHLQNQQFRYAEDKLDGVVSEINKGAEFKYMDYNQKYPDKFEKGTESMQLKHIAATATGLYWDSIEDEGNPNVPPITARLWTTNTYTSPDRETGFKPRILEYVYYPQELEYYMWGTDFYSRLFFAGFISGGTTYDTTVGQFGVSVVKIPYAVPFTDQEALADGNLSFDGEDGLFDTYYGTVAKIVETGRQVKASIYFNNHLWKNSNFSVPKYFDSSVAEINGYWILEKISKFDPLIDGTYECTFIQVIPDEQLRGTAQTTSGTKGDKGDISGGGTGGTGFGGGFSVGGGLAEYERNSPSGGSMTVGKSLITTTRGTVATGKYNEDAPHALEVVGVGKLYNPANIFIRMANGRGVYHPSILQTEDPDTGDLVDVTYLDTEAFIYVSKGDPDENSGLFKSTGGGFAKGENALYESRD